MINEIDVTSSCQTRAGDPARFLGWLHTANGSRKCAIWAITSIGGGEWLCTTDVNGSFTGRAREDSVQDIINTPRTRDVWLAIGLRENHQPYVMSTHTKYEEPRNQQIESFASFDHWQKITISSRPPKNEEKE